MTDSEKMQQLFQDIGIQYEQEIRPEGCNDCVWFYPVPHNSSINMHNGDGIMAWQHFFFMDGKLVGQGIWD